MKKNGFRVATLFVVLVMVNFGSAKAQEVGEMASVANVLVGVGKLSNVLNF